MKKRTLFLLLIIFSVMTQSQEKKEKESPIIFVDLFFGSTIRYSKYEIEPLLSASIYYQYKRDLFGVRFSELKEQNLLNRIFIFTPFFFIGNPKSREYAILYGKRFINNKFSYSFMGGFSYIQYANTPINRVFDESYQGFPFEISIRWFKSNKRSIMLFGLIPITKPTGFGSSFGIKLFGNISKKSYIGLGLTLGLGYYKNYN